MKIHTLRSTLLAVLGAAALSSAASASNVAVVDSGTYFGHRELSSHVYQNTGERAGNLIDDDRNGKVDDVSGWNFAENYDKFFYPEHIQRLNPIIYRVFNILAAIEEGTVTEEDKQFWEKTVKSLPAEEKEAFKKHLNFYGQYAHGTHVSGIIAKGARLSRIMSARIFPDTRPEQLEKVYTFGQDPSGSLERAMELGLIDELGTTEKSYNPLYWFVSWTSNQIFHQVGAYLNSRGMDVANYSIGVGLPMLAKAFLGLKGKKDPTAEEIEKETRKMFSTFEPAGKKWMASASKTLFVIAAGNDGSDNDKLPYFPASVAADNSITVAASKGYSELARFSNYGATTAHVAAPGVAIMSTVPGSDPGLELPMSGTSMAAPYVTMIASNLKDINANLTPSDLKTILMGTVDKKPWLIGKVASVGVVNAERAYRAAELSKTLPMADALATARAEVENVPEPRKLKQMMSAADPELSEWAADLVF